jgi:PAS domain S-box-containing protein
MTMKLLSDSPHRFQVLRAPIMDTADAAFAVSLDCQILAWGTRAQQLFGFTPAEILGQYCYDMLPAHDAAGQCLCSVNCPMVVAARSGYSVGASEARICTKQKCWVWVRVSPVILREPQGTATAILVVASDVTSYKRTEQLVRRIIRRIDAEVASLPRMGITPTHATADESATVLRSCFPDLTQRESEVLWEAISGEGYHKIAATLGIRPTTARNYLQRVLAKLGVHSQRKAVLKAALALVTLGPVTTITSPALNGAGIDPARNKSLTRIG